MPYLFKKFWRIIKVNAGEVTWRVMGALLAGHFIISWLLLWLAQEDSLISRDAYIYFYVTTAMTVGYGDLSPKSEMGRLVAAFWLMPGGISILAAVLGKIAAEMVQKWRRGMLGQRNYENDLSNHTVILGWQGERTLNMVRLLLEELNKNEKLVLVVNANIENPFPDAILFVRADNLTSKDAMTRAGIASASKILIYGSSDEETLTIALRVTAEQSAAHVVAHFEDAGKASLLKAHCPGIEVLTDITVELLVRSAQDPGSSLVTNELVSTLSGPTQYCAPVPDKFAGMQYA
ncbi:MAG TPA: ion channel, partial [Pseudomonadales bacterium]|nr:ion channel [Pseudomonadales bacterium]